KEHHPDRPEWLSHVNANVLKIKLSMALIGISSIHLLETFINIDNISTKNAMWRVIIHCVFIISAAALAWTSKLSEVAEATIMHPSHES
ncbi:MAG TPA: YqhA family protein, partial [Stellaceae bacterium]|nr:YqhA family protein [Stellaceae bacterium]